MCCGVREYHGINRCNNPKTFLMQIGESLFVQQASYAYVIFTQTGYHINGIRLAFYIQRNGLGSVTSDGSRINPNTLNFLKVWVWGINRRAFRAWYEKKYGKIPV